MFPLYRQGLLHKVLLKWGNSVRSVWSIEAFESDFLGLCRCQVFPGCFIVEDARNLLGDPGFFTISSRVVFSSWEMQEGGESKYFCDSSFTVPSDHCDSRASYGWEKLQGLDMPHSLCNIMGQHGICLVSDFLVQNTISRAQEDTFTWHLLCNRHRSHRGESDSCWKVQGVCENWGRELKSNCP